MDHVREESDTADKLWWQRREARVNGKDPYLKVLSDGDAEHAVLEEEGDKSAETDRGQFVPQLEYLEDVKKVSPEVLAQLNPSAAGEVRN